MSDIATLLAALNDRAGVDFIPQFTALMTAVAENVEDIQAALTNAYSGTSTTSMTIGTGAFTLTLTGLDAKQFKVGLSITVASTASPANRVVAVVSGWDTESRVLSFNVEGADDVRGSGTFSAWTISPAGAEGAPGPVFFNPIRRTAGGTLTDLEFCFAEISATVTFNLPPNPTNGVSRVRIKDVLRVFGTYRPIIGRGTETIEDLAEDMTLTRDGCDYEFYFINSTWRITRK